MIRKSMKMLLCALLAAFTLSSIAEAAPKKALRHRTKHSSRVASGSATTDKKPAAKKTTATASAAKKKSGASVHRSTAKKPAQAKRRPTTKPR